MTKPKVISISNQKGGVGKSTTVYNLGASLALEGKKALLLYVDPKGDLTKMLGQRKPHDFPLTLANAINDVVSGTIARDHPEIMHHHKCFDFMVGNRCLSTVEVGLVNVISRKTVLRQYADSVKLDYDYVLLNYRPSLGMLIDGVFLTIANKINFRKDIVNTVKANFGKHLPVMDTAILTTVRLTEISTSDKSIFHLF